ncbi:TIGR03862 family flavoprotein [Halomonas shantousis]
MPDTPSPTAPRVAVIGAGPAGLMAAEVLSANGVMVEVFEAMPTAGRKFLMAGVGGMNITHSEPHAAFVARYGERAGEVTSWLEGFDAEALREWIHGLGIDTFVGSSGRVFPTEMKAAPLLRAWLKRLREQGVTLHVRHRWRGWNADGSLRIVHGEEERKVRFDAVILALGGGSWPRLGSDGAWVPWLADRKVAVSALRPANCGFEVAGWSELLRERFAGAPLKPVGLTLAAGHGPERVGEMILTAQGVEGGLIYAFSAKIRERIARHGRCTVFLDLAPQRPWDALAASLAKPRGKKSLAKHLKARAGIEGAKAALLRELATPECLDDPGALARTIKTLPLTLVTPRPLAEAISSAGGVTFASLTPHLMLQAMPGVFCAGEMLDWEAPTGGYLLTACFASGRVAACGTLEWLRSSRSS